MRDFNLQMLLDKAQRVGFALSTQANRQPLQRQQMAGSKRELEGRGCKNIHSQKQSCLFIAS